MITPLKGLVPIKAGIVAAACEAYLTRRIARIKSERAPLLEAAMKPRRHWLTRKVKTLTLEQAIAELEKNPELGCWSEWNMAEVRGRYIAAEVSEVMFAAYAVRRAEEVMFISTWIAAILRKDIGATT